MSKYVCSVCGFIYDEAKGIPEMGILPNTKWKDLPENWVCPICGVPKSSFIKQDEPIIAQKKKPIPIKETSSELKEMTALELSALCSNLSRGCEKQYKLEEAALFKELGDYFGKKATPVDSPNVNQLVASIEKDLERGFPAANGVAKENKDRGALRALTWSEKVTRVLKSLLIRYQREGETMIKSTGVYVCTICGFIYVGNNLPEICPICKVPNWKFEKMEGRA